MIPGVNRAQASATDVVLYASEAPVKVGNWQVASDTTAAGGARLANLDFGAAKITSPSATPASYFEMSFQAQAATPYHLWIRGKAQNDSPYNDSVFIQFSDSSGSSGAPLYRIGTTSATTINLEDDLGVGLSGWGWQDNGWGVGVMGDNIYFAAGGTHTLRVQVREDGLSIDQIVLSPATYLNASPGALKNDTTILPKTETPPPAPADIVVWASDVPNGTVFGNWAKVYDSSAAGSTALHNPDLGVPKLTTPLASPINYFEVSFNALAATPYHLWIRGKADGNSPYNDSVYVQFSGSVDSSNTAVYRIGTNDATAINLEDYLNIGVQGWGWQDNGWGVGVMGPPIYFQSTGSQTIRVQVREDGFSIDQIVLSPVNYLSTSPGALKNDVVILASTIGSTPPPANQPPVVTIAAAPTSGAAPLPVSFTSTASDPDGSIASYQWDFGDGQSSTSPNPSHTYGSSGSYLARLTVTDNLGATASATLTITVTPPPTGAVTLKVMTWNSQGGNGTDNVHNLDRQATWIANMHADVVSMCEVYRYSGDDQAQILTDLLTQKTGVTWSFYWVPKYPGCLEGNLILTRWAVVDTSFLYLSYQRSVARMKINVGGKLINFFATHLDAYTASYRQQEISELTSWAAGFAEPRLVAGDFNSGPDGAEIAQMVTAYFDSWNEALNAGAAAAYPDNPVQWQTRTRRGRLDYVFFSRGASTLTLRAAQIPDQRDLSRPASELIGTSDDLGVRPSDHNFMTSTFDLR